VIIAAASLVGGLTMLLLAFVMLIQHPWLLPGTVVGLWWLARRFQTFLRRL
jgi:hypothetical protein